MKFLEGISPREYQRKIFETCTEKNCLVVLPTGLGKTLVALMLVIDRLEKFPGSKAVFLAPTRPLAEQHLNYFKKHLPELFAEIQLFTGEVKAENRRKIWQTADIIFSTPQCVANDLKNRLYDLSEVSLLIEDEAHRCLKNYDYNYIAQVYKSQAKNQRILGLTASPGSEAQKIREICRNLSIEEVELRTRSSPDVKQYLQELEFEKVTVEFPKEMEEIRKVLKKIFDRYIEDLKVRNIFFGPPTKIELINLQKRISGFMSRGNTNFNYMMGASICAQAIKIQHAMELLETQTLESFKKYLDNLKEQAYKKTSKGVVRLVNSNEFEFVFSQTNELLVKGMEHPKVGKMVEITKEIMSENKNAKILLFTQFRDTASLLSKTLNNIEGIRSKIFVGQAKRGDDKNSTGLSQKEQKKVIEDFSSGEINVLCATSIGEEGLDIPEVSAVIFYEPVSSVIRAIQRAGRTARLSKGKLIILITGKTRDERFYYVSRAREKGMHKAIDQIKDSLNGSQKSIDSFTQ